MSMLEETVRKAAENVETDILVQKRLMLALLATMGSDKAHGVISLAKQTLDPKLSMHSRAAEDLDAFQRVVDILCKSFEK